MAFCSTEGTIYESFGVEFLFFFFWGGWGGRLIYTKKSDIHTTEIVKKKTMSIPNLDIYYGINISLSTYL
jgi:hypothetical protein